MTMPGRVTTTRPGGAPTRGRGEPSGGGGSGAGEPHAVAPGVLGPVERRVGGAVQARQGVAVVAEGGDAPTEGAGEEGPVGAGEPLAGEARQQLLDAPLGVVAGHAVHADDELLAAPAPDDVLA